PECGLRGQSRAAREIAADLRGREDRLAARLQMSFRRGLERRQMHGRDPYPFGRADAAAGSATPALPRWKDRHLARLQMSFRRGLERRQMHGRDPYPFGRADAAAGFATPALPRWKDRHLARLQLPNWQFPARRPVREVHTTYDLERPPM